MATKQTTTVQVNITRKLGDDIVYFNAQSEVEHGEENHEYNRLFGCLRSAVNDYINNVLPTMAQTPSAGNGASGEWIAVSRFSVSHDKGKKYVKAHAGRYEKYGVVIYPEAALKSGLDLKAIPDDGYTPKKLTEVLISTDKAGKPRVNAVRWDQSE